MPKNKGKGGKGKRRGKRNKGKEQTKRELRFKEFGEEYAQVQKNLGGLHFEVYCFDGKTRMAHVRGRFKKRVWINKDDIILVGLREYQDERVDIVHKYTPDEARILQKWGELPSDKVLFDEFSDDEGDKELPEDDESQSGSDDDDEKDDDDEDDDDEDDDEDEDDEDEDEDDEDENEEENSEESEEETKGNKKKSDPKGKGKVQPKKKEPPAKAPAKQPQKQQPQAKAPAKQQTPPQRQGAQKPAPKQAANTNWADSKTKQKAAERAAVIDGL